MCLFFLELTIVLMNPSHVVMFFLIILEAISWLPYSSGSSARYECGEHGRFEYCIDGIPGCVVGCHCHPGYFFDTETKVCEPNDKLIHDYQRHHHDEPTRIQINTMDSAVEQHVNAITNDTDDIGDWLYNQFFKTIENQVLNQTDKEKKPTRRIGGDDKVLTRRSNKRKKKYFKRSHRRHRRKNLAIPPDDSVFASSGGGSSGSDSDSGSSDSEDSKDSRDSAKKEKKDEGDGHGHSKILIINKKPKPPLPSFIFLPNMDTPFFPPVGIGMPAMPMYPMVPVPPLPASPTEADSATETTAASGLPTHTPAADTPSTDNEPAEPRTGPSGDPLPDATPGPADPPPDPGRAGKRQRGTYRNPIPGYESDREEMLMDPRKEVPPGLRSELRKKAMLRRLRNRPFPRQNKPNQQSPSPKKETLDPDQNPSDGDYETDTDTESSAEQLTERNIAQTENVNFKYLSELIKSKHFPDLQKLVAAKIATEKSVPLIHPFPMAESARRSYNPYEKNKREFDDNFYSNLGRQIATLIRHVDPKDDQNPLERLTDQILPEHVLQDQTQFYNNPERMMPIPPPETRRSMLDQNRFAVPPPPVQPMQINPPSPIFNENSYAARSYWERSVRSPLAMHATEQYDYVKQSNEDLYDLENRVKHVATATPFLSLSELENMINRVKKHDLKNPPLFNNAKLSNTNFNVDLLPTTESYIYHTQYFHDIVKHSTSSVPQKIENYEYRNVIHDNYPRKNYANDNRNIGNLYNDPHLANHKLERGRLGPYIANPSNNNHNLPRNLTMEQSAQTRRFLKNFDRNLNIHNLSPYDKIMLSQRNLYRPIFDKAVPYPDYQIKNRSHEYPNMANFENSNYVGLHPNHKNRNLMEYPSQGLRPPSMHRAAPRPPPPNGPPPHVHAHPPPQQTAMSSNYQLQNENQVGSNNLGHLLGQKPNKHSYFQHGLFFDDFEN